MSSKIAHGFFFLFVFVGFVELGVYDQVCLLECCWLEVLMVGLMWRSINHPGNLVFASDLILNRYFCFLLKNKFYVSEKFHVSKQIW